MTCTIALVHGAFAESASWERVIDPLTQQGHAVEGASHAIAASRPDATVHPILEAAALRVAA